MYQFCRTRTVAALSICESLWQAFIAFRIFILSVCSLFQQFHHSQLVLLWFEFKTTESLAYLLTPFRMFVQIILFRKYKELWNRRSWCRGLIYCVHISLLKITIKILVSYDHSRTQRRLAMYVFHSSSPRWVSFTVEYKARWRKSKFPTSSLKQVSCCTFFIPSLADDVLGWRW